MSVICVRMWIKLMILDQLQQVGRHFRSLCKTWCESVQKCPSHGRLTDIKMAAAAIWNLLLVSIFVIGCL